jgi:spore coat polysaccharide biosynthesis protein SpsF
MNKIVTPDGKVPVKKIGIVIQCREKSTRLPNKWKLPIMGEPMLLHVITRCVIACTTIRHPNLHGMVVVAIPDGDNELEQWLLDSMRDKKVRMQYMKGSQEDVLSRYVDATEVFSLDYIVRITADCPLIPPDLIGAMINLGIMARFDYLSNTLNRSYPDGYDIEFMTRQGLMWINEHAKDPSHREHVTSYLLDLENKREFAKTLQLGSMVGNIDLSHLKISVDTEEEYERVKKEFDKIARIQAESEQVNRPGSTH